MTAEQLVYIESYTIFNTYIIASYPPVYVYNLIRGEISTKSEIRLFCNAIISVLSCPMPFYGARSSTSLISHEADDACQLGKQQESMKFHGINFNRALSEPVGRNAQ